MAKKMVRCFLRCAVATVGSSETNRLFSHTLPEEKGETGLVPAIQGNRIVSGSSFLRCSAYFAWIWTCSKSGSGLYLQFDGSRSVV